jgi:hypothetical protein
MTIQLRRSPLRVADRHRELTSTTPWPEIVRLAALGTMVMVLFVAWRAGGASANPLTYIQPGADGPSAALFREDFPDTELPAGLGLDGQQFYAMASDPLHPGDITEHLDRPEYRLRRPMYAWVSAALHPTGGGLGLVYAMVLVNIAALFAGGVASGALSTALGGRLWPALAFPLLPGSYMALRVSVADAMAVALALGALACAARRREGPAIALAAGAALTKETMLVVLAGWAISQRSRRSWLPFVAGTVIVGAWSLWLRVTLPGSSGESVDEIVAPFTGIPRAIEHWAGGEDLLGLFATAVAIAGGVAALVLGGRRHPLAGVVALNLALMSVMRWNVLALDFGGTRSTLPVAASAVVVLASTRARVLRSAKP